MLLFEYDMLGRADPRQSFSVDGGLHFNQDKATVGPCRLVMLINCLVVGRNLHEGRVIEDRVLDITGGVRELGKDHGGLLTWRRLVWQGGLDWGFRSKACGLPRVGGHLQLLPSFDVDPPPVVRARAPVFERSPFGSVF